MTSALPKGRASPDGEDPPHLSAGRYDSFIVRVLSTGAGGDFVHGQVIHVSSRQSKPFTDLEAVVGFIRAQIGEPAGQPNVGDRPV